MATGDGHALRSRDHRQTHDPDAFIHVTPAEVVGRDTDEGIAAGTEMLLEGGAEAGSPP